MKIFIINGPNINMLGIREPDIYGSESFAQLNKRVTEHCDKNNIKCELFQSNHEGAIIDFIQSAYQNADGIVINPGGYTHTSVAIADALSAVGLPFAEVHITDVSSREDIRRVSYIRDLCKNRVAGISGQGIAGYLTAIDKLVSHIEVKKD